MRARDCCCLGLVAALLLPHCGGQEEESPLEPANERVIQEPIEKAAWEAVVAADPQLAALVAALGLPFQAAGRIEDEAGAILQWGEYAPSAHAPRAEARAAFRLCAAKAACTNGSAIYTPTGAEVTTAEGKPLTEVAIGAPVLLKLLKNHNPSADFTVLSGQLSRSAVVDPTLAQKNLDAAVWGKRRCVILHAYGPAVGESSEEVRAAAVKTKLFDDVVGIDFARRSDVDALLPTLTPLDVVIWLAAGVQEPFSDKPPKSVGMTLSRGIFGDTLYSREQAEHLLDAPPLGGPGLIALIGSNTLAEDFASQTGVFAHYLHLAPQRPVVGVDGQISPAAGRRIAVRLLERLAAGQTLASAMEAAAPGAGVRLRTPMIESEAKAWLLPGLDAEVWQSAPKSASMVVFVKVDPMCVTGASPCNEETFKQAKAAGKLVDAGELTAYHAEFRCPLEIAGRWLQCQGKDNGANFTMKGLILGLSAGQGLALYLVGDANAKYRQMTVVGAGEVLNLDVGGGTTKITFNGEAAASTFVDDQDRCCIAKMPLLQGVKPQVHVSYIEVKR